MTKRTSTTPPSARAEAERLLGLEQLVGLRGAELRLTRRHSTNQHPQEALHALVSAATQSRYAGRPRSIGTAMISGKFVRMRCAQRVLERRIALGRRLDEHGVLLVVLHGVLPPIHGAARREDIHAGGKVFRDQQVGELFCHRPIRQVGEHQSLVDCMRLF